MSLLQVEKISKSYHGKAVLQDLSFSLERGDRLALIGDNGAGKTTVLKILAGLEVADADGGKVILARGAVSAYLDQNLEDSEDHLPPLSDPQATAIEQDLHELAEAMSHDPTNRELLSRYSELQAKFESIGGFAREYRMEAALGGLGLDPTVLDRPLSSFSGGERMRVKLARLLISGADLLLLDEPTNHLDSQTSEWLINYLKNFGGSLILVSHDRHFLDQLATHCGELSEGRIRLYRGNYSAFKQQEADRLISLEKEEKKLRLALQHEQEVAQTMLSHRKMTSYHNRERRASKLSIELDKLRSEKTQSAPKLRIKIRQGEDRGDPTRVLIEASEISMQFADADKPLFENLSFSICGRDRICLVGPNGCGKSTLLNCLIGAEEGFSGRIMLSENLKIGFLSQDHRFLNEEHSIFTEVCERADDLTMEQSRSLLAAYGFSGNEIEKRLSVLSGGERSRLLLCLLIREQPDILLLDEPTNHIDIRSREILEDALEKFSGTLLSVSHDRYYIERSAKVIWGFIDGKLSEFSSYSAYLAHSAEVAVSAKNKSLRNELSLRVTDEIQWDRDALKLLPELKQLSTLPQNRNEERRFNALAAEAARTSERLLHSLEAEKESCEAAFATSNDPEIYSRYSDILHHLEILYSLCIRLIEYSEERRF